MAAEKDELSARDVDAELVQRAKDGDDAAFDRIVSRHAERLYALALYLIGAPSDAEDVLQETLLGAYQGLHSFQSRASLKTWMSRILVRQVARHHRSAAVRKATQPLHLSTASKELLKGAATESATNDSEIRMDVLEVLQTLRLEFREVVVLREINGLSYEQIAEVLNIPQGTVESRLYRARQELQERLKDYL
jgi:RNA polymerase sigma-70 factor, ECF subfamily